MVSSIPVLPKTVGRQDRVDSYILPVYINIP